MQTALSRKNRALRSDPTELQIRLEEQNEVVAEVTTREENEARAEAAERKDELKTSSPTIKQALTRSRPGAIQASPGAALERGTLCHLADSDAGER